MDAIHIDDLTKRYGDYIAIDELNLTVNRGEALGFLGPNGAGKSTTINVLLDYVRPTTGTVQVLGHDTQTETQTIHKRIGVLPDGYSLYDRLTGNEHLELAAQLKQTNVDVRAVCDRVGLDQSDADRPTGAYSKGMSQRLALGMALVGNPDLLILDEPTTGLDPHGVSRMKSLIQTELDRGTTVFFSSHVLDHVESACDRVAILDDGKLVAVDTIDGLREAIGSDTLTLEELFAEYTEKTGHQPVTTRKVSAE
jgi:ABC-2 type transport system ATP-binding protein